MTKLVELEEHQECQIPNCQHRTWTIESTTNFNPTNSKKNRSESSTVRVYKFPQYTKLLVRNEIKLYTLASFFSDVGGFLGLLLGESLVSYVLLCTNWLKQCCSKFKTVSTWEVAIKNFIIILKKKLVLCIVILKLGLLSCYWLVER